MAPNIKKYTNYSGDIHPSIFTSGSKKKISSFVPKTRFMKFIVSSSALLKHLQQISGVISANTVLPILEDFLFEVEKNKLIIVATDLETVMKVHMEVEARETGQVCIPAKILLDSLKNIADQPLAFTIDKQFSVEITSDNGKYKVMGENPDNFPKDPSADETTS
ncbi:MAG TPA: DNA polymerase III subunit beta, partial [Puia sp.]|nr:DNA polymerase III subunit beta [Puia sp.]